jgi:hypothetical protein
MSDLFDDDPLADYQPGSSSPGPTPGDDSTARTQGPDEPADTAGPSDLDNESGWPTDDLAPGAFDDVEHREYRGTDLFPIEEYGDYADNYPDDAERLRTRRGHRDADAAAMSDSDIRGIAQRVVDTLRNCLAALQGRTGSELMDMLVYAANSKQALGYLGEDLVKVYARLSEILISEYDDDLLRTVDLGDICGIDTASAKVQAELGLIRLRVARDGLPKVPTAEWKACVNYVQRMISRQKALGLASAIAADETDESCMALFRTLEPPTASKTLQNESFSRSAQDWEAFDNAAEAEAPGFRIASGYPTLDFALTQKDSRGRDIEPRGSWAPGELHILAAPTGNGKSAAARRLITAAAEDLVVGWGREHDRVLIAISEESPKIVYQVAGLGKGQPSHHLAKNVIIANVGASRRRFVHAIWDCVIDAFGRSQDTGQAISSCGLPSLILLDYVQALQDDNETEVLAVERSANLLMRGCAAWDVAMMEQFSGESFAAYAGMSWPTGMESFKPAVLAFAQYRKLADPLYYPEDAKKANLDDFVLPNADGSPGWNVEVGDFRIPSQGEVRGSGVLINHATTLVVFHRSRPVANPRVVDPATGKMHLTDTRARWILQKARNGTSLPFVEMRFDSTASGLRGQFYDQRAEIAVERGLLNPTECYREAGDPILPHRTLKTPFDGISY